MSGSVVDQVFVGPVSGAVARAVMHFLVAGRNPVCVVLRGFAPAAVVPGPVRTRVMPVPAYPYVMRTRPLGADLMPARGRPVGHDADVQVARHERRGQPRRRRLGRSGARKGNSRREYGDG